MSINNIKEARTQIRELSVILAIADAGSGNGCYDLGALEDYNNIEYGFEVPTKTGVFTSSDGTEYISNNIIDFHSDGNFLNNYDYNTDFIPVLEDGIEFCNALRNYNIDIDYAGVLHCEQPWSKGESWIAKRNYALGKMLAWYFGIGPGIIEKITWYGPQNLSGAARRACPPADIGIKMVGSAERVFPSFISEIDEAIYKYDYRNEDEWEELVKWNYYDTDSDIMISLKDGSEFLGTMGFAPMANLMLGTEYTRGTDFFELYSYNEYNSWFDTAWTLMIDYLYKTENNYSFQYTSQQSGGIYMIQFIGDDEILFTYDGKHGHQEFSMPRNTTRESWKQTQGKLAKKAFSKWCTKYGNKQTDYIAAQVNCSRKSASIFTQELTNNAISEKFYQLVGWRMASYFYAKITRDDMLLLAEVPTAFNCSEYKLKAQITGDVFTVENVSDLPEALRTQSEIPFNLSNDELQINADFRFIFRFTDGMFSGPPQVQIKTEGEFPRTYYGLAEEPLSKFL